jgi:hypothetical protein
MIFERLASLHPIKVHASKLAKITFKRDCILVALKK